MSKNPATPPPPPPPSAACAACRYQRRRCAADCPLAPYFPADNHQQFLNAHKLFSVHNIVKTLTSVPSHLRDDAMKALIFTADVRAKDPVGGCYRIVLELQAQLSQAQAQLNYVVGFLNSFREDSSTVSIIHQDRKPPVVQCRGPMLSNEGAESTGQIAPLFKACDSSDYLHKN